MSHVEAIIDIFRPTIENALADDEAFAEVLASRAHLLGVLDRGEKRRLETQERLGVPVPRSCIFSVTWRCNLSCVGCYAKAYTRSQPLDLGLIEATLEQACHLGSHVFVISGGEPLTVEGLVPALARRDDGFFFLFTNGTTLDDDAIDRIAAAPNVLPVVSIEGPESFTDWRRGEGVTRRVFEALERMKKKGIPFAFSTMVTHRSVETVTGRPWFDRMWEAGARFGFLIDYIPFPRDLDPSLVLTGEDLALKAGRLGERNEESRPRVFNFPPDEYRDGKCRAAGKGFIHINADGFVEPCPFSHFAADNIKDKTIEEILRSAFFTELRREAEGLENRYSGCALFEHSAVVEAVTERTGASSTETA